MDITLKQLRAFVAVANMGQFTLAAEKLGSSQSAVSTLIRQLEANLNLRLFDRHTRLLRLTQAGIDLLPIATRAVTDIEGMVESSRDLNALRRGKVSVAAGTVQAALLLPSLVHEFNDLYPEITVALYDVAEKVVMDYVAGGLVDLGVGTIPEGNYDLAGTRLMTDEFLAVLHPRSPLVNAAELHWISLTGQKLIGPQRGNPIRDRLENELARNGILLSLEKTMQEIALPLTILGMVEGGLGIAIMTSAVTRLANSMGLVVRTLTAPLIRRDVSLVQKRGRSLSPAALRFRNFLLRSVH